jgi:hypothetical protein
VLAIIQFKTIISHLLYKMLKIRIYKTVDLYVYYEMWFLTLREEHMLQMF